MPLIKYIVEVDSSGAIAGMRQMSAAVTGTGTAAAGAAASIGTTFAQAKAAADAAGISSKAVGGSFTAMERLALRAGQTIVGVVPQFTNLNKLAADLGLQLAAVPAHFAAIQAQVRGTGNQLVGFRQQVTSLSAVWGQLFAGVNTGNKQMVSQMQAGFGQISAGLGRIASTATQIGAGLLRSMTPVWQQLQAGFSSFGTGVIQALTPIVRQVQSTITSLGAGFAAVSQQARNAFAGIGAAATQALAPISRQVSSQLATIAPVFASVTRQAQTTFSNVSAIATQTVNTVIQQTQTIAARLGSSIAQGVSQAVAPIARAFAPVATQLQSTFTAIGVSATQAFRNTAAAVVSVGQQIQSSFARAGAGIAQVFTPVVQQLQSTFTAIGALSAQTFRSTAASVGAMGQQIRAGFAQISSGVTGVLAPIARQVGTVFSQVGSAISQTLAVPFGFLDRMLAGAQLSFVNFGQRINQILQQAGTSLNQFAAAMQDLGIRLSIAVTAPLVLLGKEALTVAGNMELVKISLEVITKSGEQAQIMFDKLKKFALETPFTFPALLEGAKRLVAYGFAAQDATKYLQIFGDAAFGLASSQEGVNELLGRIILAFGQIQSKGTVMAQEMRQLAEANIGAWQILADGLGKSVGETMKMVENRMVTSAQAIPILLAGMQARFGGLMQKATDTLLGQFNKLRDQVFFLMADLGNAFLPAARMVLDNFITPTIAGLGKLVHAFSLLPPSVIAMTGIFVTLVAVVGPLLAAFGFVIKGIYDLSKILGVAAIASRGFGLGLATTTGQLSLFGVAAGTSLTALGLLSRAFLYLGAVMVALDLVKWITQVKETKSPMEDMYRGMAKNAAASPELAKAFSKMADDVAVSFKQLQATAKENQGFWADAVDQLRRDADDYAHFINRLITKTKEYYKNTPIRISANAINASSREEIEKAALPFLKAEQSKLATMVATSRHNVLLDVYAARLAETSKKVVELTEAEQKLLDKFNEQLRPIGALLSEWDTLSELMVKAGKSVGTNTDFIRLNRDAIIKAAEAASDELKTLSKREQAAVALARQLETEINARKESREQLKKWAEEFKELTSAASDFERHFAAMAEKIATADLSKTTNQQISDQRQMIALLEADYQKLIAANEKLGVVSLPKVVREYQAMRAEVVGLDLQKAANTVGTYGIEWDKLNIEIGTFGEVGRYAVLAIQEIGKGAESSIPNIAKLAQELGIISANLEHMKLSGKSGLGQILKAEVEALEKFREMQVALGRSTAAIDARLNSLNYTLDLNDSGMRQATAAAFDFANAGQHLIDKVKLYTAATGDQNVSLRLLSSEVKTVAEQYLALGQALPADIALFYDIVLAQEAAAKSIKTGMREALQQVSLVLNDLAKGIADAIVDFENLGKTFEKVAKDILRAILRIIIEQGMKPLLDWMTRLFDKLSQSAQTTTTAISSLATAVAGIPTGTIKIGGFALPTGLATVAGRQGNVNVGGFNLPTGLATVSGRAATGAGAATTGFGASLLASLGPAAALLGPFAGVQIAQGGGVGRGALAGGILGVSGLALTGGIVGALTGFGGGFAGGTMLGLGALGGPIGIAIAGLAVGIGAAVGAIGRGRREANRIVPVQNQVTEQFAAIVSNLNELRDAGNLTQEHIDEATEEVTRIRDEFFAITQQFGRAGPGARRTIGNLATQIFDSFGDMSEQLEISAAALRRLTPVMDVATGQIDELVSSISEGLVGGSLTPELVQQARNRIDTIYGLIARFAEAIPGAEPFLEEFGARGAEIQQTFDDLLTDWDRIQETLAGLGVGALDEVAGRMAIVTGAAIEQINALVSESNQRLLSGTLTPELAQQASDRIEAIYASIAQYAELLGDAAIPFLTEFRENIGDAQQFFDNLLVDWGSLEETLDVVLDRERLEELRLAGARFGPVVGAATDRINDFVNQVNQRLSSGTLSVEFIRDIQNRIQTIYGLVAEYAEGIGDAADPFLETFREFSEQTQTFLDGLLADWDTMQTTLRGILEPVSAQMAARLSPVIVAATNQAEALTNEINRRLLDRTLTLDFIRETSDKIQAIYGAVEDFGNSIGGEAAASFVAEFGALTDSIQATFGNLLTDWQAIQDALDIILPRTRPSVGTRNLIPEFQSGGFVPSTGLAFLHQGEFVLRPESVNQLTTAFLSAVNRGTVSSTSGGGETTFTLERVSARSILQEMERNPDLVEKGFLAMVRLGSKGKAALSGKTEF